MSKKKILSAGFASLLFASALVAQPAHSEMIQPTNHFQTTLEARNSGNVIAGMFRLVWRFITRG